MGVMSPLSSQSFTSLPTAYPFVTAAASASAPEVLLTGSPIAVSSLENRVKKLDLKGLESSSPPSTGSSRTVRWVRSLSPFNSSDRDLAKIIDFLERNRGIRVSDREKILEDIHARLRALNAFLSSLSTSSFVSDIQSLVENLINSLHEKETPAKLSSFLKTYHNQIEKGRLHPKKVVEIASHLFGSYILTLKQWEDSLMSEGVEVDLTRRPILKRSPKRTFEREFKEHLRSKLLSCSIPLPSRDDLIGQALELIKTRIRECSGAFFKDIPVDELLQSSRQTIQIILEDLKKDPLLHDIEARLKATRRYVRAYLKEKESTTEWVNSWLILIDELIEPGCRTLNNFFEKLRFGEGEAEANKLLLDILGDCIAVLKEIHHWDETFVHMILIQENFNTEKASSVFLNRYSLKLAHTPICHINATYFGTEDIPSPECAYTPLKMGYDQIVVNNEPMDIYAFNGITQFAVQTEFFFRLFSLLDQETTIAIATLWALQVDNGIPLTIRQLMEPSAAKFFNSNELFKDYTVAFKSCEWQLTKERRTVTQKWLLLIPSKHNPTSFLAKLQAEFLFCIESKKPYFRFTHFIPLDATLEELTYLVDTLHGFTEE